MLRPATVFLNGQFMSKDKAYISPDDRGFYFADGVYEVIKYYKGKPFCFDEHISRLRKSLQQIKIDYTAFDGLASVCDALIEANNFKNKYAGVYLQITRGEANRTHRFPAEKIKPTVYARAFYIQNCLSEMAEGVVAITREDIRWLLCNVKSISLLPNTLLFEEAAGIGAFECILVRNGHVTEATHSNVFAVKNSVVYTHPDSNLILPGITKAFVIRLCRELDIDVTEEPIKADEIGSFDEWFLTGTGSEIVPVVQINHTLIGDGSPGKITRRLQNEFMHKTFPGVRIVYPSFADDAAGLLRTCIRSEGFTMFLEPKALYNSPIAATPVPEDFEVPFGKARIRREGSDMTVLTYGNTTHMCLQAADKIANESGASIEVIDLRSLIPLDREAILNSVKKTGKVLIVHEDKVFSGFGAEVSSIITEEAFEYLDGPVRRVGSLFTPVGFSRILEKAILPDTGKIEKAMKDLLDY